MTSNTCLYENAVAAAARSGEWSPEIEAHRDGCLTCAELTLVVSALAADAEELAEMDTPLPDPGQIWLRARLATRERDCQRATRAIGLIQGATVATAIAIGVFFAPGLWNLIKETVATLDLSSPIADMPRAAGSPLLIVVSSMLVLGGLALWELTVTREN
ncbi:MAG: hypothetical protein P8127_07035 [Acidobacteriota bacterium]|jgi:hypothetical protein